MIANNKLYLCSDESVITDKKYDYIVDLPEYKTSTKDDIMLTYFVNIIDFSNSIDADKILLLNVIKYGLLDLNDTLCSIDFDDNKKLYYFTGIYEESVINNIICKFIKDYILCKVCDKPFVKFKLRNERLKQKCFECSAKKYVNKSLEDTYIYKIIKLMF